jgi:hypothetical protein
MGGLCVNWSQGRRGYFFFADFFDVDFFDEVDFFEELDFFDDDFFAVDFFEDEDFFDEDFFDGTLPPSRRASESPMAMACLRLVTFLPERPLFSFPRFISCMFSSTLSDAFFPYLLAIQNLLHIELCKWRARLFAWRSTNDDRRWREHVRAAAFHADR